MPSSTDIAATLRSYSESARATLQRELLDICAAEVQAGRLQKTAGHASATQAPMSVTQSHIDVRSCGCEVGVPLGVSIADIPTSVPTLRASVLPTTWRSMASRSVRCSVGGSGFHYEAGKCRACPDLGLRVAAHGVPVAVVHIEEPLGLAGHGERAAKHAHAARREEMAAQKLVLSPKTAATILLPPLQVERLELALSLQARRR